jgi:hypothetical protein
MNSTLKKERFPLPWHGWIFGIILFLFGSFSAYDYVMSITQGETFYRASGMTETQVAYYMNFPSWATVAWTISVFGMFLASAALLLRFRIAFILFAISLAGSLLYIIYVFGLSKGRDAMGVIWPAPLVIAAITAAMIFYCVRLSRSKILV